MKLISSEAEFRDKSIIRRCEQNEPTVIGFFLAGPMEMDLSLTVAQFTKIFKLWTLSGLGGRCKK